MAKSTANRALNPHHTLCDSLFRYAELLRFGEIHVKMDEETGLKAIIAIHNLNRGSAIGGCRMITYQNANKAIEDALRLSYMMSFKAAINNLAHGGGKSVLMKPKVIKNYDRYFEKFGEFVNELGGRYVTAIDSGTSAREMDIIARRTSFVTCTSMSGADGDPSPLTALGVRRAIEASVKFKLKKDSLAGIRVNIQGAGHVGYYLAKELFAHDADITMTDINPNNLARCIAEFHVATCTPEEIYDLEGDVFAPCALGAILNLNTIKRLRVSIVAGSANNQLSHHHYGAVLYERGILYAPDFLINAGGLIHVAVMYDHGDSNKSKEQINNIYFTLLDIYERSARENRAPNEIAENIAAARLW
jgi:leucine dehydrogenase